MKILIWSCLNISILVWHLYNPYENNDNSTDSWTAVEYCGHNYLRMEHVSTKSIQLRYYIQAQNQYDQTFWVLPLFLTIFTKIFKVKKDHREYYLILLLLIRSEKFSREVSRKQILQFLIKTQTNGFLFFTNSFKIARRSLFIIYSFWT